jgi:hypothetical protein
MPMSARRAWLRYQAGADCGFDESEAPGWTWQQGCANAAAYLCGYPTFVSLWAVSTAIAGTVTVTLQ